MKKRIFLIVSSIVCCLVSLSLVVYTIVKATQTGTSTPGVDDPTTGVSKPGYEETVNTQNVVYNLIVGDTFSDDVLVANSEVLPTILAVTEDNKIVAKEAGSELFVVETNGVRYNYDVQVWTKGSGTSEDPYNIIRAEDLVELVAENNSSEVYYSQQMDLDLAGQNWIPLGNEQNVFKANYDGNGYAIKNMSIIVNEENLSDFVCNANGYNSLHLGFFGYVYESEIKNVTMENALIDTTAIDNVSVRESLSIDRMYVGGLVGTAYYTNILASGNTVSVTIKSSAGDQDGVDGAVGGLAGMITGVSKIDGYTVNAVINASDISFVKSGVNYGANVAGIAGRITNSYLTNCTVNADIIVANYAKTKVAGAVVTVDGASYIQNLNVENVKIELNKVVSAEQCVRMAGAIDYISQGSRILNSTVKNAQIMGITCGQVSGFASMNEGTIIDCNANGTLKGVYVAGLVDTNEGTISYTNEAGLVAVNVTINAQLWGAGLVNDNYGTIQGASDKTAMNAQIYWYRVAEKYFDRANSMLAGIATINSGKISNLYVIANMYDAVNAGGAVGWVMDSGSILENLEVYTTVRTIKQNGDSAIQTYTVGGIVAVATEDSTLAMTNVVAKMSVNAKAISAYTYTLDVFGAVIGKCYGTFNIAKVEVGVSVYANDTINVDETTKDCAKVRSILGGYGATTLTNSSISEVNVYGKVNVSGSVKSIKDYSVC